MAHSWSLAVEMQFYLLSPWLIPWLARSTTKQLFLRTGALLALAQLWQGFVLVDHWNQPLAAWFNDTLYSKPLTRLPPYLMGALVALLWQRGGIRSDNPGKLRLADSLALGCTGVLVFLGAGDHLYEYLLDHDPFRLSNVWLLWLGRAIFAAALGWLLLAVLQGRLPWLQRIWAWHGWVPVAGLSYALYLVQYVALLPMLLKAGPYLNATRTAPEFLLMSGAWLLGAFFLAAFVALVLHLTVERPLMNLRKR